jgi:O-antigen/teichoic acid export membrane protein
LSGIKSLIKYSLVYLSSDVFSTGLLFIEMALISRALGIYEFGYYSAILAIVQTGYQLFVIKPYDMFFHYYSKYTAEQQSARSSLTILLFGSILLSSLLFIPINFLFFGVLNPLRETPIPWQLVILACMPLVFKAPEMFASAFFRQINKVKNYSGLLALRSILELSGVIVVLYWLGKKDVYSIFLVRTITMLMAAVIGVIIIVRNLKRIFPQSWNKFDCKLITGQWKRMLQFSIFSHMSSAWHSLYMSADTLVVSIILGDAPAGPFRIAKNFALLVMKVIDPVYNVVFPQLAQLWHTLTRVEFKRFLIKVSMVMAVINLPGYVVYHFTAPIFIPLIAGAHQAIAVLPSQIIMWAHLPLAILVWQKPLLMTVGKPGIYNIISLASALISFAMITILTVNHGLVGAAIGVAAYPLLLVVFSGSFLFVAKVINSNGGQ